MASSVVRRTCLLVMVASLVGCGDGPTEPPGPIGSLSFNYSGAESGGFDVTGFIHPEQGPYEGAGAFIFAGSGSRPLAVVGIRLRNGARQEHFEIWFPEIDTPGSYSLDGGTCPQGTLAECPLSPLGLLRLGLALHPTDPFEDFLYYFTSGTVQVTSLSTTRMTGTFAGTATTYGPGDTRHVITVTDGAFDVPITSMRDN